MNSHFFSSRPLRRAVTLLCAALAGTGLMTGRASAQAQGPLPASPGQPNPYQSPLFHSGGALDPDTAGVPPLFLPGVFQPQLQGTPTGLQMTEDQVTHLITITGTVQTQIPSYLLGDYDPALPPRGFAGTTPQTLLYYPNHFADGGIYSWQAPFDYLGQANGYVQVDDASNLSPYTATTSGFTASNNWALINNLATYPAAGTAIGAEYLRLPAGPADPAGTATWQIIEPTAGSYAVYLNIPNDLNDSAGNPEPRSTAVVYFITIRDAGGNVTATTTATASQTEANANQFLAGPFLMVANGSVTVTLTHNSAVNLNVGAAGSFLVADAVTVQTAIGDVQSTPTAINYESYPNDFARAKYWGIYVPNNTVTAGQTQLVASGATAIAQNAIPDTAVVGGSPPDITKPLFHYGDPTKPVDETGAADPKRRIRQLVYFGRSDPAAGQSTIVDDSAGAPNFSQLGGQTVTDGTASNLEYLKFSASAGTSGAPVATWTLTPPAGTVANTNFFVTVHLPRELENRIGTATYTVSYGPGPTVKTVTVSQIAPNATDAIVTLPTGAIPLSAGETVTVQLFNYNGQSSVPPNTFVVADSASLTTGTGQGAIYCVDGFNGEVLWRFETPATASASAPVFSSPVVAKINVLVTPAGPSGSPAAVYQNKLVVIVGDNNGLVYCLDAIGNGDGTSNADVLQQDAAGNPINGQFIYQPQPPYGSPFTGLQVDAPNYTKAPHVGTTGVLLDLPARREPSEEHHQQYPDRRDGRDGQDARCQLGPAGSRRVQHRLADHLR